MTVFCKIQQCFRAPCDFDCRGNQQSLGAFLGVGCRVKQDRVSELCWTRTGRESRAVFETAFKSVLIFLAVFEGSV